jgi:glycosyltransferase involved in cell wall biosynthesis
MDRSRIAIVIPALNESSTITDVVIGIGAYGIPIVVDDGSSDDTANLAKLAGAYVVSHEKNMGYDSALNTGFKLAFELGSEIIITADADGQHDPSLITRFINSIDAGFDVVIGIRSRRQRFAEHMFAWYSNVIYGIRDPLCGMKAYRTSVYNKQGYFDSCGSIGTQLAIFAAKNNYRIKQINIKVRERNGKPRFGKLLEGNYKIIRAMLQTMLLAK